MNASSTSWNQIVKHRLLFLTCGLFKQESSTTFYTVLDYVMQESSTAYKEPSLNSDNNKD